MAKGKYHVHREPAGIMSGMKDLGSKTHVKLPKVMHRADIYIRLSTGEPVLFHYQGLVMRWCDRWHWEQSPDQLVPLDMSNGRLFLSGHGRAK